MDILVRNEMFGLKGNPNSSLVKKIGVNGFAVLSILMALSSYKVVVTTVSQIMSVLSLKTPKLIVQALIRLKQNCLINVDKDLDSLRKNDVVCFNLEPYLELSSMVNGFFIIPEHLFKKHFPIINASGWALYCLIYKVYNTELGYAYPSEHYLSEILGHHKQTISKYATILQENRLIKIVPQKSLNPMKITHHTNHYIVYDKQYRQIKESEA